MEITSAYDKVKYGDKVPKAKEVDEVRYNIIESIEIIKKSSN